MSGRADTELLIHAGMLLLAAQNAVAQYGTDKEKAAMLGLEDKVHFYQKRLEEYAKTL